MLLYVCGCVFGFSSRIGDDAMFFLLHKCTLFHPLHNGCFLQISGHLEIDQLMFIIQCVHCMSCVHLFSIHALCICAGTLTASDNATHAHVLKTSSFFADCIICAFMFALCMYIHMYAYTICMYIRMTCMHTPYACHTLYICRCSFVQPDG